MGQNGQKMAKNSKKRHLVGLVAHQQKKSYHGLSCGLICIIKDYNLAFSCSPKKNHRPSWKLWFSAFTLCWWQISTLWFHQCARNMRLGRGIHSICSLRQKCLLVAEICSKNPPSITYFHDEYHALGQEEPVLFDKETSTFFNTQHHGQTWWKPAPGTMIAKYSG